MEAKSEAEAEEIKRRAAEEAVAVERARMEKIAAEEEKARREQEEARVKREQEAAERAK